MTPPPRVDCRDRPPGSAGASEQYNPVWQPPGSGGPLGRQMLIGLPALMSSINSWCCGMASFSRMLECSRSTISSTSTESERESDWPEILIAPLYPILAPSIRQHAVLTSHKTTWRPSLKPFAREIVRLAHDMPLELVNISFFSGGAYVWPRLPGRFICSQRADPQKVVHAKVAWTAGFW
jgi:hypothetical protein